MSNIIEIDLDSCNEYISKYDDDKIDHGLRKYIMDSSIDLKKEVLLKINFHYDALEGEKKKVSLMLKNDFKDCLQNVNNEIKKINFRDIVLVVVGFWFLVIYWYLEKFHVFLFSEFCLIISWVAFWKVAESMLFLRRKLNFERRKCKKLLDAKIEFSSR